MLSHEDKQKIKDYFAKQPNIEVVYLFGSQSDGKANSLSDIDLAVLFSESTTPDKRFDQKLTIMGELGSILKTNDIDLVDLNSAKIALRFSAIENRDIIFLKNNSARVLFEADTMSRYQDYKYYISENTKNSLASISVMDI